MKKIIFSIFLLLAAHAWSMAPLRNNGPRSSLFFGSYHQTDNNQTRLLSGTSLPIASHFYALTYSDIGGDGGSLNTEFVYYFGAISRWNLYIGILAGPDVLYDNPSFELAGGSGIIIVRDGDRDFGLWLAWKAILRNESEVDEWQYVIGGGLYFYMK